MRPCRPAAARPPCPRSRARQSQYRHFIRRHRARSAETAAVPHALGHLGGGQYVHVDERCRSGVADDAVVELDGDGRAGADRLDAAGVPARAAERCARRHPAATQLADGHAALGRLQRRDPERGDVRRRDEPGPAAAAHLRQRHRPGAALAGVFGDHRRGGAARGARAGAGAQRRGDEPGAHRRADRRRCPAGEHRRRLRVRAQRGAFDRLPRCCC